MYEYVKHNSSELDDRQSLFKMSWKTETSRYLNLHIRLQGASISHNKTHVKPSSMKEDRFSLSSTNAYVCLSTWKTIVTMTRERRRRRERRIIKTKQEQFACYRSLLLFPENEELEIWFGRMSVEMF